MLSNTAAMLRSLVIDLNARQTEQLHGHLLFIPQMKCSSIQVFFLWQERWQLRDTEPNRCTTHASGRASSPVALVQHTLTVEARSFRQHYTLLSWCL